MHGGWREICKFQLEHLKGREHFGNIGVAGMMVLQWLLEE